MKSTPPSSAADVLALWDRAACAPPAWRDDAILSAVRGDAAPASLAERNTALFDLRGSLFGPSQALRCNCPRCDAIVEFSVDCAALAQSLAPVEAATAPQRLVAEGHRIDFRLPDIDDLRAVADDPQQAVARLLHRCVTRCERGDGQPCDPTALPDSVRHALSERMEALAPGASVGFDLACPECGQCWSAPMDVGQVLWTELNHSAERLLLEVDALARSYGWSEAQVLALSPARRAAYLQLVGAA